MVKVKTKSFAGHTGSIRDLVFHPDGTHLTSIGTDATIRIWNMADAREAQVFNNPEPGRQISISSDATTIATYGGLDNTVKFWKLRQRPLKPDVLPPQKGIILSVALSTNGNTAVISSHDSLVSRWDIEGLKPLVPYSQKVLVHQLALSADGQTLVTAGGDNLVKVWHVESGRELGTLRGHPATPSQLALSADGKSLVSVGVDNTVRVWATSLSKEKNRLLQDGIVVYLAVSPDGETLATSDPNFFTVKLWDLSTLKPVDFLVGEKCTVAFSPEGKWLALLSFDGQLRLCDRSTTPYRMGPKADVGAFGVGSHLKFSHGGKTLALRGPDRTVLLWNVAKQEVMGTLPKHSTVCATAFRADDEVIATGSRQQIRLWEVASQRLLARIPGQHPQVRSLCFSPDGHLLAAASGNTELRLWDVSDPTHPRKLPPLRGHTAFIERVAFSPDGKTLATGGRDSTLRLWDVSLREQVAALRGHSSVVSSLAWSPDGNTIFTGSGDASVRLWYAPSWKEIEAAESRQSTAGQPQ